ncbi:hypothetical protein NI389_18445 (plasmid) [Pseudoalteromonas xiamenensis]|uniref:hypothetical protein n=1 Tax=Pseudoalteromonas xiamenensis TaxID=882626 RepID=UPI0027E554FF|nr:hypothetical protein [Pseudoalteromonas xiamenensis]WMN61789.1 hypothetical protein NI389_18445 [Pseudoalteromonas xiamenensis]
MKTLAQLILICFVFYSFLVTAKQEVVEANCEDIQYQLFLLSVAMTSKQHPNLKALEAIKTSLFDLHSYHCRDGTSFIIEKSSMQSKSLPLTIKGQTFQDESMQRAWESHYALPEKCREKDSALSTLVWCSEDKKKQRQRFLLNWQSNREIRKTVSLVARNVVLN